jgi:hypothetical protein
MDAKSAGLSGDDTLTVSVKNTGHITAHCPLQELAPLARWSFAK